MKEKRLLLLSSLFMFLYLLINVILIVVFKSVNDLYNYTDIIILSSGLIGIIYFLYLAISKTDLNKHRFFILVFSIIFFLYNIISGVLGFIVFSKTSKIGKRELPKLEIQHNYKWYVYLLDLIVCIGILFFLPESVGKIGTLASYIGMMLLNLYIFRKDLKRDFTEFRKYFREYNSVVLSTYIKGLVALFILSLSIRLYTGLNTPTNQESINLMLDSNFILTAFLAIIYAPFVEELLFRGVFRKFINNKWLYIFISGLLFGLAHVIDDFQSVSELLYVLVYGSLGCFLASLYYKTNNICTNMLMHIIQNTLSILAILLLKVLV